LLRERGVIGLDFETPAIGASASLSSGCSRQSRPVLQAWVCPLVAALIAVNAHRRHALSFARHPAEEDG
jgi:hypothetical protein